MGKTLKLKLNKQTQIVFLSVLTVALLSGLGYGGYWYWQSIKIPSDEKNYKIVDNTDGSRTFYSYIYNFRINYPNDWELDGPTAEDIYREINLRKKGTEKSRLNDIVIISGNAVEGLTFEEHLGEQRQHSRKDYQEELIPLKPNFEVAGVPAYKYNLPLPWESAVLTFERGGVWYEVWLHQSHQNDSQYWSVLNTFGFIK